MGLGTGDQLGVVAGDIPGGGVGVQVVEVAMVTTADGRELSDADIANLVLQKYGYIVIAYSEKKKIGETIQGEDIGVDCSMYQPYAVIVETTCEEYEEHNDYVDKLLGRSLGPDRPWPHYYRVTTD
jgi:hypothetical protein